MTIIKQIPNAFTLGNLTCGVLAIHCIQKEAYEVAVGLVFLAAVLDFFDGFLARLLKADGPLGKELDSLADLVTFGVAPSFMLYALSYQIHTWHRFAFIALAVFSAYRLAKFNIDTRQSQSFIGVPTPITGIMVMSWAMVDQDNISRLIFDSSIGFVLFCALISYLLVSEIPLPSLKLKKGPVKQYSQHLFLLGVGILSMFVFGWLCIPIFYTLYVLSSILINFASKKTT